MCKNLTVSFWISTCKKLEKEQTALERKVCTISNEVSALHKAVEKLDDHLKIFEARLARYTT